MDYTTFTPINWVFLVSLGIIVIGLLGRFINRSLVELRGRLKPEEGAPKHSWVEDVLLPKRKAVGLWANKEFHEYIDLKAQNKVSRFFLKVTIIGVVIHSGAWVYMLNFADK